MPPVLDALTLQRLAVEFHDRLAGARVNRIQQPGRHDAVFTLWRQGQTDRLLLHPASDWPAVCLLGDEPTDWLDQPLERPTGFCMLLRKHLNNAVLSGVDTLPGERVLNFYFDGLNEMGDAVPLLLSLELMPRTANLLLVDRAQNRILGADHNVSDQMSRLREVAGGLPYLPPPSLGDRPILSAPAWAAFAPQLAALERADWPEAVSQWCRGVSKATVATVLASADNVSPDALGARLLSLQAGDGLSPAVRQDGLAWRLLSPEAAADAADWEPMPSVSALVQRVTLATLRGNRLKQLRQDLDRALKREHQRLSRQQSALSETSAEDADRLQAEGQAILTAVSAGWLPEPPTSTVLDEATGFGGMTLTPEPGEPWPSLAQRRFQQARKARSRAKIQAERAEQLAQALAFVEELQAMAAQVDSLASARALRADLVAAALWGAESTQGPKPKSKPKPADDPAELGILKLVSQRGVPIWVGRSAQANGALSGGVGRPDDLWLHVLHGPGAHVLLRLEPPPRGLPADPPDPEDVWDAALLAVYFSPARDGTKVPVVVTRRRWVRKIPNSYPGHVTYKQEEAFTLDPDPERLARLLRPGGP